MDRSINLVMEDRDGNYIRRNSPPRHKREEYHSKGYVPMREAEKCKNRIKEHRLKFGISLSEVAQITGQNVTTVARHETRTQRIPAVVLEMYSELYQVDIKRLLVRDDSI